jgi:hypothetical protein
MYGNLRSWWPAGRPNYDLEWNAHEPSAVRAGIDAKVIDVVRVKAALTGVPEPDAAVIRFGRQMFTDKRVDSATFAKIVELYGQRGAMDIVAVMNTYAVSGFYAIAVDEQPAAGKPTSAIEVVRSSGSRISGGRRLSSPEETRGSE